jgi:hypothetical protein
MNLASGNMMTGVVEIELTEVTTSNKAVPKDKARGEKRRTANPLGRLDYDPYTYSFELTPFPKDQVDVYRALKQELQWYEDELTKNPNLAAEDQLRLSQDKIQVERKINDWTHPPPANYAELNPPIAIKVDSLPYLKTGIENIYGWWWFNMDGGIWCYYFGRNKTVRWYDIYNHKNGQGNGRRKMGLSKWSGPPEPLKDGRLRLSQAIRKEQVPRHLAKLLNSGRCEYGTLTSPRSRGAGK